MYLKEIFLAPELQLLLRYIFKGGYFDDVFLLSQIWDLFFKFFFFLPRSQIVSGGGVRSGGQGAPRSGAPPPTTYL